MTDTTPIARFLTRQAADDAAELLRANDVKCAVVDPPMHLVDPLYPGLRDAEYHTLVVAADDAGQARQALDGSSTPPGSCGGATGGACTRSRPPRPSACAATSRPTPTRTAGRRATAGG